MMKRLGGLMEARGSRGMVMQSLFLPLVDTDHLSLKVEERVEGLMSTRFLIFGVLKCHGRFQEERRIWRCGIHWMSMAAKLAAVLTRTTTTAWAKHYRQLIGHGEQ